MSRDDDTITERTFTITIECNNAAFDDEACGPELARILRALADELADHGSVERFDSTLFDLNGNQCGSAEMFTEEYRR